MKPSKATFYAALFAVLLASRCMGQPSVYNAYASYSRFVPALVGIGVGYLLGTFLACAHCHSCSEENDNTVADCTEEEGCALVNQPAIGGVIPSLCSCTDEVFDIFS